MEMNELLKVEHFRSDSGEWEDRFGMQVFKKVRGKLSKRLAKSLKTITLGDFYRVLYSADIWAFVQDTKGLGPKSIAPIEALWGRLISAVSKNEEAKIRTLVPLLTCSECGGEVLRSQITGLCPHCFTVLHRVDGCCRRLIPGNILAGLLFIPTKRFEVKADSIENGAVWMAPSSDG